MNNIFANISHQSVRCRLGVALVAFLLVFAELTTLEHEAEHSSHEHTEVCESFIAHASSPAVCVSIAAFVLPEYYAPQVDYSSFSLLTATTSSANLIRAPPRYFTV